MTHTHDHSHEHTHEHAGPVAEQLSTIAVSAAYAGIMLILFYVSYRARAGGGSGDEERTVLSIIAPWIQLAVLAGGAILLVLVSLRALAVWRASRQPGHSHSHHDHEHTHDHGPGHNHAHDHDHEHGWSPMKFIPLVLPLVMFFLGLPNTRMIRAVEDDIIGRGREAVKMTVETDPADIIGSFGIASLGDLGMNGVGGWEYALSAALSYIEEEAVLPVEGYPDHNVLEQAAQSPPMREYWRGLRRVELQGKFDRMAVMDQGQTLFRIVRIRVACCLNDGRPAMIAAFSRRNLNHIADGQWIAAQGRLDFQYIEGKMNPVIRVFQVKKEKEPVNPYLK